MEGPGGCDELRVYLYNLSQSVSVVLPLAVLMTAVADKLAGEDKLKK